MGTTSGVETDDIDSSAETESLLENTPRRVSEHEIETSTSVFVTSEQIARQIRTVTDPLSRTISSSL